MTLISHVEIVKSVREEGHKRETSQSGVGVYVVSLKGKEKKVVVKHEP